jgi:UDP-2,3-diacylglucosamine hydrolase
LTNRTSIYFASDLHLGAPNYEASIVREKLFVKWLDEIKNDAEELYLVGDVYDFWFEYNTAIPKYFSRLHGKLAELTDSGIKIYFFSGNHDMWMFTYYKEELNIEIIHQPIQITRQNKELYIGHGDGLGPGDKGYKFLKLFFRSSICQFLFSWIHPDIGMNIAQYWSRKSRLVNGAKDEINHGEDEWLIQYTKRKLIEKHYDYFIFGHRHLPLDITLSEKSRYINLGDWINYFTYAKLTDGKLSLLYYKK